MKFHLIFFRSEKNVFGTRGDTFGAQKMFSEQETMSSEDEEIFSEQEIELRSIKTTEGREKPQKLL